MSPEALTVFARARFCAIWAEAAGAAWQPLDGCPGAGVVSRRFRRLGLRRYELAPRGLYWGSATADAAVASTLFAAVARLRGRPSTLDLTLNCRHDAHGQLEAARRALGRRCRIRDATTHVLPLAGRGYEQVVAESFGATTRRKLRLAERGGLVVARIESEEALAQHAALHRAWAVSKGLTADPPLLFARLVREMPEAAILLGARAAGRLVASILVFRDRSEWFYWHGARDAHADGGIATHALLARAIEGACADGAQAFNLGASSGVASLAHFKERFGAEPRPVWSLRWTSPLWQPLVAAWRRVGGPPAQRARPATASSSRAHASACRPAS
jgi:hypothetical protein